MLSPHRYFVYVRNIQKKIPIIGDFKACVSVCSTWSFIEYSLSVKWLTYFFFFKTCLIQCNVIRWIKYLNVFNHQANVLKVFLGGGGGGGGGGQSNYNKNLDQVKEKLKQKIPNYKKNNDPQRRFFFSMLKSLLKFHN